jgi:hypothetical protein
VNEQTYRAVKVSRPNAPIKWAVVDGAGEIVRTFGGDQAREAARRYVETASGDGNLAAADRERNARSFGLST